jgi:carbamate kinase
MTPRRKTAIVAAGGNSLIIDEQHKSIPDQYEAAAITCRYIVDMIEQGWNVVITHGNGLCRRRHPRRHRLYVPARHA